MSDSDGSERLSIVFDGERAQGRLSGDLTVSTVDTVKDDLFSMLNSEAIALDLSALEEIDTCGLQLLLVFQRQAAMQQRGLGVSGVTAQFADLLDLYGLSGFPQVSVQEGRV